MKKILLGIALVFSAGAVYSGVVEPVQNQNAVEGLISEVNYEWTEANADVTVGEQVKTVQLVVNGPTSVACSFGNGVYWVGSSSDQSVVQSMYLHCRNEGGLPVILLDFDQMDH